MKSFFKKLSFVMALAMVVSMLAPAGSVFAATAGIAKQGTKEVVTEVNVEVGKEVVDFCFLGAPANWKETFKWDTSNPEVATVDQSGKVTALKNGVAEIIITAGADYKHTVKVNVGATAADMAVVQLTEKSSKLVFDQKVDFKKEDAQLLRVFSTDVETVEVNWPIDGWDPAKDGMSITFSPFVDYADGDKYIIKVGDFTKEFTTTIGEVTHVMTTYKTGNTAETAFITPEDEEDVITTLGVKIMSGTVDLTNVYLNKFDISYEFYQGAEYENANLDEDDGEISFSDKGAVMVTAVVSYEDEEGEDQTLANVMPVTITPVEIPEYEVVKVVDWTTITADTAAWQFSWDNKSLYAGDEGYQIVLKLEDNRGNFLTTAAVAAEYEANKGNKNVYVPGADSEFAEAGYAVEFHSTNTDDFLLDTDGSIATYKKTNAVFYVKLFKDNEDGEKVFVRNIYANELKVDKAREITNVIAGDPGDKRDAVIDAVAAGNAYKFVQVGFWIGAFDQSWTKWADLPLVKDGTLDAAEFEVVATSPAELIDFGAWVDPEKQKEDPSQYYPYLWTIEDQGSCVWLNVDADEIYEKFPKSNKVTFTVQEVNSEKKVTVTVNLKKPTRVTYADLYDEKGELKDTKYTYLDENEVRRLNSNVVVSNRGQWSDPQSPYIVLDLSKGQLDVAVDVADKNLGYDKDNDKDLKAIDKDAVINLYKLSNKQKVAFYTNTEIKAVVANADWDDATTGIAVGEKYVAVVNPKNKYVPATINADNLTVDLLTMDEDGKLTYAESGKYTVYVYTVNKVTKNDKGEITDIDYVERKDTFTVSYGQADVTCADRVAITTEHDFLDKDGNADKANIAKIIVESFAFALDGKGWDIDEVPELVDMDNTTYTIKGDNIIIRKVTFKVPYDGGNSLADKEAYYTKSVNVNMAVEYKAD